MNIKNEKYKLDDRPIDDRCNCPVCQRYSRAYLRHLFKAEEMLAMRLSVTHNLFFYNNLMEKIRSAIDSDCYNEFCDEYTIKLDARV